MKYSLLIYQLFGMSEHELMNTSRISLSRALALIKQYAENYPLIKIERIREV